MSGEGWWAEGGGALPLSGLTCCPPRTLHAPPCPHTPRLGTSLAPQLLPQGRDPRKTPSPLSPLHTWSLVPPCLSGRAARSPWGSAPDSHILAAQQLPCVSRAHQDPTSTFTKIYRRSLCVLQAWVEDCYAVDFSRNSGLLGKLEDFISSKVTVVPSWAAAPGAPTAGGAALLQKVAVTPHHCASA